MAGIMLIIVVCALTAGCGYLLRLLYAANDRLWRLEKDCNALRWNVIEYCRCPRCGAVIRYAPIVAVTVHCEECGYSCAPESVVVMDVQGCLEHHSRVSTEYAIDRQERDRQRENLLVARRQTVALSGKGFKNKHGPLERCRAYKRLRDVLVEGSSK